MKKGIIIKTGPMIYGGPFASKHGPFHLWEKYVGRKVHVLELEKVRAKVKLLHPLIGLNGVEMLDEFWIDRRCLRLSLI